MKKPGPHWSKLKQNHLLTYPECRVCGDRQDVVVHHLRYRGKRGEAEHSGDLVTLCSFHHNALHRVVGPGSRFVANAVALSLAWIADQRAAVEREWLDADLDN
jgi:hypothetical protein